ncbi:MAG TPA: alkaline phosphatase D family protein [Polyangiaceae bacterium]|nr:alkaline phosphatase D family protein [Polyangiaceae bacterium]
MSQLRRRREILKLSVLAVGALPTACYRDRVDPPTLSEEESAAYFPQSVASGDPRPDSVVLWTRAIDPNRPNKDVAVALYLALDEAMSQGVELSADSLYMTVSADSDNCLAARVSGLTAGTTYYYQFRYTSPDGVAATRVGRTRTAPAEDSKDPVKFAVICCQDYGGKYFHVARHVAEQEVDFVLHLGDYIYETAGDPSFQSESDARSVTFSKPKEALQLDKAGTKFLAAQSLSNYRDLYKLYRSDPDLQALHERHPMIVIWDDHEFADDSHGDVSTYSDGQKDETSPDRRAAADQAWFEYMPIDYKDEPTKKLDKEGDFPDNFAIYRSFVFGQHLELVVTDLRRYRPDHLVPEDAAPGAVYLTAEDVTAQFETPPTDLVPYVDITTHGDGAYLAALTAGADTLAITADSLSGDFSAVWINQALAKLEGEDLPAPIDVTDESLPRGYAYHCLLKTSQFSRIGSRYVVAVEPFEALAKKKWDASSGKSEMLMGKTQRDWFLKTLRGSERTFKVWASEVAFMSRHIDLRAVTAAPPELQTRISISAEDWDGFPNERRALLKELSAVGNVVVLSGDLHCFFAGTPFVEGDEATRVVELTTGSATSSTWLDNIQGSITDGGMAPPEVVLLVQSIGSLLADKDAKPNPHLAYQALGDNGYSIVEVGDKDTRFSVYRIATKDVATKKLKGDLDDHFSVDSFRTKVDSAELEQEIDGEFLTWSREELEFT